MKKSYNFLSGRPFIRLDNNEVKIIREAMRICDEGNTFARKIYKGCEGEEIYEQGSEFSMTKIYLCSILSKGRIYYYKKRKQYYENFSKWKKATHEAYKRKGNLPVFDLKNGRII